MKKDSEIFSKLLELVEERSIILDVIDEFDYLRFTISQHDSANFLFKSIDSTITGELYFSSKGRLVRCIVRPPKEMYNNWKLQAKSLTGYSFMLGIANSSSKFTRITFHKIMFSPAIVSFHIGDMIAF